MGQAAKNRVLGRALMMLVDNECSMKLITCCVVVKQPRRVVGRHLCGLEQRCYGSPLSEVSEGAAWLRGLGALNIACYGAH